MNKQTILLLLTIVLFACSKTCPCDRAPLTLIFEGFTIEETDTIYVTRYIKESGFSQTIDTLMLTNAGLHYFSYHGDSVIVNVPGPNPTDFDYMFRTTSGNSTFLYGIMERFNRQSCSSGIFSMDHWHCSNSVGGYYLNNVWYSFPGTTAGSVYITK